MIKLLDRAARGLVYDRRAQPAPKSVIADIRRAGCATAALIVHLRRHRSGALHRPSGTRRGDRGVTA